MRCPSLMVTGLTAVMGWERRGEEVERVASPLLQEVFPPLVFLVTRRSGELAWKAKYSRVLVAFRACFYRSFGSGREYGEGSRCCLSRDEDESGSFYQRKESKPVGDKCTACQM